MLIMSACFLLQLLFAKDHIERAEQLEQERQQLKGKVAALQLQLDSSLEGPAQDSEEVHRLRRVIEVVVAKNGILGIWPTLAIHPPHRAFQGTCCSK